MTDQTTLAYINMFAVLGSLQELCDVSPQAKALIRDQPPIVIAMVVKNGPAMTISFRDGRCTTEPGAGPCTVKLPFSSPEKFNGLIAGTTNPFPSKGFTKIKFLLNVFTPLTDILSRYLQATPEDLADETFFQASTGMMLNMVTVALAQIGNHDRIGRFTASNMQDGRICLSVRGGPAAYVEVRDHALTAEKRRPEKYSSIMEFRDMRLARGLFDGRASALASIGRGEISIQGYIANIDNVNRLLDRVQLYLG